MLPSFPTNSLSPRLDARAKQDQRSRIIVGHFGDDCLNVDDKGETEKSGTNVEGGRKGGNEGREEGRDVLQDCGFRI